MNDNTRYLINVGICIEKLRNSISGDIFENLSKHNPWYDSQHEIEADKLDELRRALAGVKEDIEYMIVTLDPTFNEE